jgi:helix-turn-helix protein
VSPARWAGREMTSGEVQALVRQVEQEGPAVLSAWWARRVTDLAAQAQSGAPTTGPTLRVCRRRPAPGPTDVRLVRGVIAERVVVSTSLDPFLSLRALAAYSGLSVRTLRAMIERAPSEALPCYRLPGKVLIRRSDFDAWLQQYRFRGRPTVARALQEMGLDDSGA